MHGGVGGVPPRSESVVIAVLLLVVVLTAAVLLAAGVEVLVLAVAMLLAGCVGFVVGCLATGRADQERALEHRRPGRGGPCGEWQGRAR